ncbi:MAG: 30S ribosomal protein S20 [Caldilineaceae bacterium]|jgi:small subunit ribosomal protein S20|nr:30S ribosomal protein S20 [Caldilineaceae bacterium]
MANTKSAEKRSRQNTKKAASNRLYRSSARTAIKKARLAIENGDPNALELVRNAERVLARAAAKGSIHRNNASRRTGRLVLMLNKSEAAA